MAVRTLSVLLCAALVACRAAPDASERDPPEPLRIEVAYASPATCDATVSGRTFVLPAEREQFVEALRPQVRPGREATVSGGADAPYRCIGSVVYAAQRAGFVHVFFIAETPPPR